MSLKDGKRYGRRFLTYDRLSAVEDPLIDYLSDKTNLQKAFNKKKLVPYSQTSTGANADTMLSFLDSLKHVSETFGACRNSIKFWATSGNFIVKYREIIGVDLGEEKLEVPTEEKRKFFENFNRSVVGDLNMNELKEQIFGQLFDNGNCAIKIVHTESLGIKQTKISILQTRTWKFIEVEDEVKIAVHENFALTAVNKEDYVVYDQYPDYTATSKSLTTIYVLKMDSTYSWYSRPYWISAFRKGFLEYLFTDNITKDAETSFIGKHILEFETGDDENDEDDNNVAIENGFDSFADRVEQNFTVKGSTPSSLIVTKRPPGSTPMTHIELKPNTNEKFYDVVGNINRRSIIESCSWSERLLGTSKSEGFNKDAIMQELEVKDVGILLCFRDKISEGISFITDRTFDWVGIKENKCFSLTSVVSKLKEEKAESLRDIIDSFAVGVRSGTITPTIEDEKYFREIFKFSEFNNNHQKAWDEDDGYRTPITLKGSDESEVKIKKELESKSP
jgi:hypothetical protein